jgi:hypothetical protein
MHKAFLIFCFLLTVFVSNAQQRLRQHTFNIELALPNGLSNNAFEDIMQGLVHASPYYQYTMKNGLSFGTGMRYAYFTINEFRVPDPVYGGMHSAAGFLKFGWKKFHNDIFATDISIKAGYNLNYFLTDLNDSLGINPKQINAIYLEPSIGLVLAADEKTSYRLYLGYGIQDFLFTPSMLGLQTNGGYVGDKIEKRTSYLLIGFGFSYYFESKKR